MSNVLWLLAMVAGTAAIVWGAERFAEHLADASKRLGVTAFALAVLLAGAESEELATVVTASVGDVGGVAFGDVIGANAAIVTTQLHDPLLIGHVRSAGTRSDCSAQLGGPAPSPILARR